MLWCRTKDGENKNIIIMKKNICFLAVFMAIFIFAGCENDDWSFDNYDYSTVYFAYQYPVRTIILGNDDTFDNTLDNEHRCQIYATLGGMYSNDKNVSVDIAVTKSLCDGVFFADDGTAVTPMPAPYYSLSSDKITIPKGSMMGCVDIQLSDYFFEDSLAVKNHYVIPLVMSNPVNVDSILQGKAVEGTSNPNRCRESDWETVPKDYILYAIKYVNQWDGIWLRRGTDIITTGNSSSTVSRHNKYVEYDETFELSTLGLYRSDCTVSNELDNSTLTCHLILTFDNDNNCTVTSDTKGCIVSGYGSYVEKGEKNSWGEQDRDAIYLNYTVDYGNTFYETYDTLVARDRQVAPEWFTITKD